MREPSTAIVELSELIKKDASGSTIFGLMDDMD
jgi:hypothetical protein